MKAVAALALLAAPAGAEVSGETCALAWARVERLAEATLGVAPTAAPAVASDGWCVAMEVTLDLPGAYMPKVQLDRIAARGGMLDWLTGAAVPSEDLDLSLRGLRVVTRTGNGPMDYAMQAQSRLATTDADLALRWDAAAGLMRVERLVLDLPGDNAVALRATIDGAQDPLRLFSGETVMALAVTEAQLSVTMHGLFEGYLLPVLAPALLPPEGEAEDAAETLRAESMALIAGLPEATFPDATKDALSRLMLDLPNPSGRLEIGLRADPGFGSVRFAGFALKGFPRGLDQASPLFRGVQVTAGWTPEDAAE